MRGCTSTLRTREARSYVLSSDTTQTAGRYRSKASTRAHAIDDFFQFSDSFNFNAHKMLLTSTGCSCMWYNASIN